MFNGALFLDFWPVAKKTKSANEFKDYPLNLKSEGIRFSVPLDSGDPRRVCMRRQEFLNEKRRKEESAMIGGGNVSTKHSLLFDDGF